MLTTKYTEVVGLLGPPAESFTRVETPIGQPTIELSFGWWTPVINRKAENCVYGDPIGCIDQVLLNRLESNTDFIERVLHERHITLGSIQTIQTAWNRTLYVYYADLLRISSNIATLRATGIFEANTPMPRVVSANGFPTYDVVNEWEKCLLDIKLLLDGAATNLKLPLGAFRLNTSYLRQTIRR